MTEENKSSILPTQTLHGVGVDVKRRSTSVASRSAERLRAGERPELRVSFSI